MIAETYLGPIVRNRSFLDVGPLWEVQNETLSVAHRHGANRLTAMDIMPPWDHRWKELESRLGNLQWERINQDICKYEGVFDVVHCSGVIYHHPEPMTIMMKLFEVTKEHLVLGTVVADKVGKYPLAPGTCLYLPGVPPRMMQTLREDWQGFLQGRAGDVFDGDVAWNVHNLYHWWWLFTKDAVIGMAKTVGFQVRKTHLEGRILTLLLAK